MDLSLLSSNLAFNMLENSLLAAGEWTQSGIYTAVFLVFSGLLMGWWWFYRDHSETESLARDLRRENEDLRASLKMAHSSHERLDERFNRQTGQLNVLQQLCDDWSTSRDSAERQRATLEAEVADKKRRVEELTADLQTEKQKRISAEDANHKLTQTNLETVGKIEKDWRIKFSKIESSLIQRQADLTSTSNERNRLTKELHKCEATIAELKSELQSQKSLLEAASKNASGLEQEYVSLESSLQESSELLKHSRAECAAALSAQKTAENNFANLKSSYDKTLVEMEQLQEQVAVIESLESQIDSLQTSMDNSAEQLVRVSAQRDDAIEAEKSALASISGLQKRIDNQESTIHRLRENHEDTMQQLQRELQERNQLEATFESKSSELELRLSEQTKELEQRAGNLSANFEQERCEFQKSRTEFEAQLAERTKTIESLNTSISELRAGLVELKTERDELRTELVKSQAEFENQKALQADSMLQLVNDRDQLTRSVADIETKSLTQTKAIAELTEAREQLEIELSDTRENLERATSELATSKARGKELMTKVEELKVTCQRISELESLVQQRDQEDEQIVSELRTLREQYANAYQAQQDLQAELNRIRQQQSAIHDERGHFGNQVDLLRSKLKASEETIRTLRRERAAVLARLANYRTVAEPDATVISFTEAMAMRERENTNYDAEYGGHTSEHAVRGTVYTEAPETTDDLKRISGIATVLEARLNDYGIYTFKQIMEWRAEAIEEFSRLLAFRDRIVRDDWIGQARYLYELKHKQEQQAA